jgi:hypothetical protein
MHSAFILSGYRNRRITFLRNKLPQIYNFAPASSMRNAVINPVRVLKRHESQQETLTPWPRHGTDSLLTEAVILAIRSGRNRSFQDVLPDHVAVRSLGFL